MTFFNQNEKLLLKLLNIGQAMYYKLKFKVKAHLV